MKWFASILVFGGTFGFGYCILAEQKRMIILLEQEKRMLIILQGEIMNFHRTLPDAFNNVALKIENPYKELLEKIVKRIQLWNGEQLSEIWQEEVIMMMQEERLPVTLVTNLKNLGKEFCYEEYTMQVQAIEAEKEVLIDQIQRKKDALEQNKKWIMWVSTMLGILCIIIFL